MCRPRSPVLSVGGLGGAEDRFFRGVESTREDGKGVAKAGSLGRSRSSVSGTPLEPAAECKGQGKCVF